MKRILLILLCLSAAAFAGKTIPNGSTSQSISVVIQDVNGDPNSSGNLAITDLDLYAQLDGAGTQSTKIDLAALATADTAWTSGRAFHKGNGLFRIDIPDANLSDGIGASITYIVADGGSGGNRTAFYEVQLTDPITVADSNLVLPGKVWDEVITSAAHSVANSAALYTRQLWQTTVTRVEQCGDAGSSVTIDLDAGASATTDYYKGQLIVISSGTGAGQARTCTGYNGGTNVATVTPAWATAPDGDSYFAVINTGSTVVVDWADGGRLDLLLDATLADTDELQTDWADGGRLDLILDNVIAAFGSVGRYAGIYGGPFLPVALLILYYRRRKKHEIEIG
jgi:hypothetical protein